MNIDEVMARLDAGFKKQGGTGMSAEVATEIRDGSTCYCAVGVLYPDTTNTQGAQTEFVEEFGLGIRVFDHFWMEHDDAARLAAREDTEELFCVRGGYSFDRVKYGTDSYNKFMDRLRGRLEREMA